MIEQKKIEPEGRIFYMVEEKLQTKLWNFKNEQINNLVL